MMQAEYCLTPGCVKAAAKVLSNMDTTVDPCQGNSYINIT
jgi:hypothetical protein